MKKKLGILLVILAVILSAFTGCGSQKEKDVLTLGFVPLIDGDKLVESTEPLAEVLSKAIGKKVKIVTSTNYVGVVEGISASKIDFGIIPPFAYVLANKESNAQVILKALNKEGKSFYRSQFFVNKDSGIKTPKDIKGKKVAFVDPSSSSGYLYPGAFLKKNGIDLEKDIKVVYSGGHDKSLQLLLNRDVDVIAVYEGAREKYQKEFEGIMEQTETLCYSDNIPYISVTVRGDMSPELREQIKEGLLKGLNGEEGKRITIELFNLYGFEEAKDSDYDGIRTTAELMDIDLTK